MANVAFLGTGLLGSAMVERMVSGPSEAFEAVQPAIAAPVVRAS